MLLCPVWLVSSTLPAAAQETPASPSQLFDEAEKAFTDKDYETAAQKLEALLKAAANQQDAPFEMLRFNLGVAYLLDGNNPKAEEAFTECIKQFPEGEYLSRAYLGVGKACIQQGGDEKQQRAIQALNRAAADPRYRAEAALLLCELHTERNEENEALKIIHSLTESEVRTPQQTSAATGMIGLLANLDRLDDLGPYLARLIRQPGVRDAIAWYANEAIVEGDKLAGSGKYEAALAVYRSIPARTEILSIQAATLEENRKKLEALKALAAAEEKKPLGKRTNLSEQIANFESLVTLTEDAQKTLRELSGLDASMLVRRGRCFYYLDRYEEARFCFRLVREKHPASSEAEAAAYAEIVINKQLGATGELQTLAEAFLKKYPAAANAEQVALLVGEKLLEDRQWPKVLSYYRDLETKFPSSSSLDRFRFLQGVALFEDGGFQDAVDLFEQFIGAFPESPLAEDAVYRAALGCFLTNQYKKTLEWCDKYLSRYPEGRYAGDILYRLAFIDSNDKEQDHSVKIIDTLGAFLEKHPDDPAAGSMHCLIGDTLKKMKGEKEDLALNQERALSAYKKAIWAGGSEETVHYALNSATAILSAKKDWQGIVDLHGEFLEKHPESQAALVSATWVSKGMQRLGKPEEAAALLAKTLRRVIADPSKEQTELLIDEIVSNLVPRKRPADFDEEAVSKKLADILTVAIEDQANGTTTARTFYGRARMASALRNSGLEEAYLKSLASNTEIKPADLSPVLLAVCGDILLKTGDLDRAGEMFERLSARYKESAYSDAGPAGLGQVALARKQPDLALEIFDKVLTDYPGMSRYKDAMLGKLEALKDLGRFDDAEKLALEIAGDRSFRGPAIPRAYLLLGDVLREKARSQSGEEKHDSLAKAHGYYQRVYTAYQRETELCAQAYWSAYETAGELGDSELARKTLEELSKHPKLQNTALSKKAKEKLQ